MNKILVTGGTGFLGRHLVRKLLEKYDDVLIRSISRNEEDCLQTTLSCHNDRLETIIGDIRDIDTLRYVLKEADTIIHLAAMKHIHFCEAYPLEAVTINIIATMNLLRLFEGNTFIGMSTDKAVEPSSCYGATKLLLEKLVLEEARKNADRDKRYMVIRSGNIFGSSGSVVQRWRQEIKQYNKITVTNLEMARFFIKVSSLVDFIIGVMEHGETGKVYIPGQKVIILRDLAQAAIELWGNQETKMEVIGVRPGERMDEKLFSSAETNVVSEMKNNTSAHQKGLSVAEIKDWLKQDDEE